MATQQLVILNVNNEEYGIELSKVNSIESTMDIYKLPETPEYIEGIINLRDKIYAVFNLRKMMGITGKETDENTRIIMANINSTLVGIIVDEVREIAQAEVENTKDVLDTLPDVKRQFASGIAKILDRNILIVNPDFLI